MKPKEKINRPQIVADEADDALALPELVTGAADAPKPVVSPGISKKKAKELLKKEISNIEKKVNSGKTMTAAERLIVLAAADGNDPASESAQTFVKNQVELARALSVDRKTIQRWRKIEGNPGSQADGRWSVAAWKEFAKKQGHKFEDEEDDSPTATQAKAQQILLQNQRLRQKIAIDAKEWIPKEVARQVFTQLVVAAKSRCFTGIPRLVTLARMAKDTTEGNEEIRKEFNDIWSHLTDSKWFRKEDLK